MSADPNNPERRETDFARLPHSPTDFDRSPEDLSAAPHDPAGARLLWIPAAYIILGGAVGALTDWLARGHAVTANGILHSAGYGCGIGVMLALIAFFRIRRRERDEKFAGKRASSDGEWAGVNDLMRRRREQGGDSGG